MGAYFRVFIFSNFSSFHKMPILLKVYVQEYIMNFIQISAKFGKGVDEVIKAVIKRIPS